MKWLRGRSKTSSVETDILALLENFYFKNDAFNIAKDAREQQQLDPFTFVYGEVLTSSMAQLIEAAEPQPGDVFYDLGSGSGKAVMTAGLYFPQMQAKGIEYIEEMHRFSKQMALTFSQLNHRSIDNITLLHGDLFEHDLSDASIVFINATGYFDDALDQLIDTLVLLPTGARIIISSKQLPERYFEELKSYPSVPMTWGHSQVTIYRRR